MVKKIATRMIDINESVLLNETRNGIKRLCFPIATFYISWVIITFNVAVIIMLICMSRKRLVPSVLFLLSLSVSDTLIGISLATMVILFRNKQVGSEFYKIVNFVILRLSIVMNGVSLILITLDRMLAIMRPFVYRRIKRRYICAICTSLWLLSLTITVIVYQVAYTRFKYVNLFYPTVTLVTTSVLIPGYHKIIRVLIQKRTQLEPGGTVSNSSTKSDINGTEMESTSKKENDSSSRFSRRRKKREIKLIKLTVTIVSVYILCWFPLSIYSFPRVFGKKDVLNVGDILFCLAICNSLLNPVIYFHHARKKIIYWFVVIKACVLRKKKERKVSETPTENDASTHTATTHKIIRVE